MSAHTNKQTRPYRRYPFLSSTILVPSYPLPLPSRPPPSPLVYLPAVTSITTPKGQARHQISVTTIDSDPLHGRRQRIGNSCCAVHGLQFSDIYRWRPSSGACHFRLFLPFSICVGILGARMYMYLCMYVEMYTYRYVCM